MDNLWVSVGVPLVIALLVNGAALLAWWSQRGKYKADAAASITGSALEMLETWEKRVKELEATAEKQGNEIIKLKARVAVLEGEVEILEGENEDLLRGAERLVIQVEARGEKPNWRPREE